MPGLARADWSIFIPRTLETHAWIDLYGLWEKDDLQTSQRRITWTDTFLKEKLTLQTAGYFYHPRFVRYRIALTGALKQEEFVESTLPPLGRRDASSLEYDARVVFLPEHPYNLEIFGTRYEPLFREQYATQVDTVSTSSGADFRYRRRPLFLHARVSDDKIESALSTTDVKRLTLDGRFFKELSTGEKISFDARYAPSRLHDSAGFDGDTTDAAVGNLLESKRFRLFSNATRSDLSQRGGPTTLEGTSRQLAWLEQLTVDLPYRFRLESSWRFQDNRSEFGAEGDAQRTALSNIGQNLEVDLKHQLYESLQSAYIFRWDASRSSGGDTRALSNSIIFNYTKIVPGPNGRFTAGVSLGQGETRNAGQTEVVDELHSGAAVPGSFLLEQPNVEAASVSVLVRSPQPPFDLVGLTEGVNYTLATVGNSLQVTVLTLPPEFLVPGKFDFRISYALAAGEFKLRTRNLGQSASLALFDNLVTPYYSVNISRSDVLSGSFPSGGLDSDVYVAGVSFFRGPWRGRVEYEDVRWVISPWRGWRAEAQFVGSLGPSTNLNATGSWQDRRFGETFDSGARPAYTEKVTSASASLQRFLFSRTLTFSSGGSYSRIQGLADSRSYSLNATVSWRVGKLDVTGGASYTDAETQGGTDLASRTAHQYYYLRLRRLLF